jgi:hypothetical protein
LQIIWGCTSKSEFSKNVKKDAVTFCHGVFFVLALLTYSILPHIEGITAFVVYLNRSSFNKGVMEKHLSSTSGGKDAQETDKSHWLSFDSYYTGLFEFAFNTHEHNFANHPHTNTDAPADRDSRAFTHTHPAGMEADFRWTGNCA